jgi:hypothetical protein
MYTRWAQNSQSAVKRHQLLVRFAPISSPPQPQSIDSLDPLPEVRSCRGCNSIELKFFNIMHHCCILLEHAGKPPLPTISPFSFGRFFGELWISLWIFLWIIFSEFYSEKNSEKTLNFFLENLFLWWFSTIFWRKTLIKTLNYLLLIFFREKTLNFSLNMFSLNSYLREFWIFPSCLPSNMGWFACMFLITQLLQCWKQIAKPFFHSFKKRNFDHIPELLRVHISIKLKQHS